MSESYSGVAAVLHNCGIYISHSSHHKHSYYLIRNAELLGFTELELELIANIARYHRRSKPKKKHEPYQRLNDRDRLLIRQLSAILRIRYSTSIAVKRARSPALFVTTNQIVKLSISSFHPRKLAMTVPLNCGVWITKKMSLKRCMK